MWLLLCGKGVGRGVEVAVFITQFPVLHDVKKKKPVFLHDIAKSLGRFLPGCPFSPVGVWGPGVPMQAVFKRGGTLVPSSSPPLTLFQ